MRLLPFLKKGVAMWMLKGSLYGVLVFAVLFIVWLLRRFSISTSKAISLGTLQYLTVQNPWMWAALLMLVVTGCVVAKWWERAT